MPDGGYYEKRPRPQHRSFLEGSLAGRRNIVDATFRDDFVLDVIRDRQSAIVVYLTNKYILTQADVVEIMSRHRDVTCIVSTMEYNQYSDEAKALTMSRGVGLFTSKEFLGAVHYDGDEFLKYVSPARRDRMQKSAPGQLGDGDFRERA